MVANPAADPRKWVLVSNEIIGFLKSSLRDEGHITLGVHVNGAG
jgi:hypothetical protein